MVNRADRYKEYTEVLFEYKYPFTWEERSFNYLVDTDNRDWDETQDYMFPPESDDDDDEEESEEESEDDSEEETK